jgi:soluble lytic murein transglycosylase-like protein
MVANGFSSLKRSVAASAVLCGMLAGCASTEQHGAQASLSPASANVPQPQTVTGVADASAPAAASPNSTAVAAVAASQDQAMSQATLAKTGRVQPGAQQTEQQQLAQTPAGQTPANPAQVAELPVPGAPSMLMDRMGQPIVAQGANQGQAAIAAVTGATAANPSAAAAYAAASEPPIPAVVAIPIPNPSRPGEAASMNPVTATASTEQSPIPLTAEMVAIQSVIPTPRPGEATLMRPTEVAFAGTVPQLAYANTQPHYDFNFDTSGPSVVPAVMTFKTDESAVSPAETAVIGKLIAKYAKIYQVPADLIHRVVHRESRYNPKAYNGSGYFGLMQIKYNTAKSMGYEGPPSGLFDAETNIKYAAKYLRGAWMVSDKTQSDAVALYARGYYYDAKRKGLDDIANGNY